MKKTLLTLATFLLFAGGFFLSAKADSDKDIKHRVAQLCPDLVTIYFYCEAGNELCIPTDCP